MTSYERASRRSIGGMRYLAAAVLVSLISCGVLTQVTSAAAQEPLESLGQELAGLAPQTPTVSDRAYSLTPSSTEPYLICPPPTPGHLACMSIVDPPSVKTASGFKVPDVEPLLEGRGEGGGYDPKDLQEAYKIAATGGSTQTVAIVDAFDDPNAEVDLAKYRAKYALPECKKENHCFRKVNQKGEEGSYPSDKYPRVGTKNVEDWGLEISLDLDMVSAICPECKILLVEANSNAALYEAEEEAERLEEGGKRVATEISNSWAGEEFSGETSYDKVFESAGVPITSAAGDDGYKVEYPAASRFVISVGGTTLIKKASTERGWEERVWSGSGSGCSEFEPKPSWQTDPGCAKRTDNDVAAVSDTASPLSVYDSYEYTVKEGTEEYGTGKLGWMLVGGTSAATPLVAGIEAHASSTVKAEGAEAFYNHTLFGVPSGTNGRGCRGYLCNGEESFNGPTGWGTPDGPLELSAKYMSATGPAEELKPASAVLAGYIYPGGVETTYHFEYGKTTSYGTNMPITNASAGSGSVWKGVSQSITGLEWETLYHYRLVATRGTETKFGSDQTFTPVPWTIQPTPASSGILEGVSCGSPSACIAVGEGGVGAEIWNGTEWKRQTVPVPTGGSTLALKGVSCTSSAACTAVGSYRNSSKVEVTLAERWNGTEWKVETTSNPTGALASSLGGVSCPSSGACMAVGSYENSSKARVSLAEGWNGTEWVVESTPNSTTGGIEAAEISCTASTACTAVRSYGAKGWVSVAERWNGAEWKPQTLPVPPYEGHPASEVELRGVSCVSSTECTTVGDYYVEGSGTFPVAERWNGTEWQLQVVSSPPGGLDNLRAISCTSALSCMAAGQSSSEEDFAEHWNGAKWQLQTMSEANGLNYLEGISCVQPEREVCTTVGGISTLAPLIESETVPIPFAETKEGTSAGETTEVLNGAVNPNGAATKYSLEYGLTTAYGSKTVEASAGSGTARVEESKVVAGLTANTTYHFRITATSSKGTAYGLDKTFKTPYWRATATPNPSETLDSYLRGVSCTIATACSAVGEYTSNASTYMPMAERWNGSEWALQSTPSPSGAKTSELYGVSCSSATACIAVGYDQNSSGVYLSLAESWNGAGWTIQSTVEPPGTMNSLLKGVSCTSATACTAVGWYENSSGVEAPWAARWNGTAWAIQSVPAPTGAKQTFPYGISCTSTVACTMAGYYVNSSSKNVPFAESWNGTEWAIQPVPNPTGATRTGVSGVSCTASTACMMVGEYTNSSGVEVTLAEWWNGTEWSVESTPNPTEAKGSHLNGGVSCTTATACTSVGVVQNSASKYLALAERWNGTEWKIQATPNGEKGEGWLTGGVSCATVASCAAVGNTGKTFAEIYG